MENLKLIREKLVQNRDEMIHTLKGLVEINSEAATPEKDRPFGKGVSDAFLYMLKKADEDGFAAANIDNYGGHIDLYAGEEADGQTMGILTHLDVVPAGDGWDTEPYEAVIKDGKMYGRGTSDDKGPTIAAYYAMKAIKDAGVSLKKNVRLVLGLDEETQWKGMDYYLSKVKAPDFGFTPDGDFPVVNGEMGILTFDLAKKFVKAIGKGIEFRSFKGGNAPNMVADYARLVLRADNQLVYEQLKERAAQARENGVQIKTKGVGKSFEITAQGVSAHGSTPEKGVNAISILMDFIKDIEFTNESINDFIEFYNEYIGFELDGTKLGIGFEDELSGKTIVNVGTIDMDTKSVRLAVNVRFPVSCDDEIIYRGMEENLMKYNIGVVKRIRKAPIYIEADDPFIVSMMEVYRRITGDTKAQPQVMGGGTYARAMKNFVAFGALFPGEEELFHQKNEYMSLESLEKAAQIYAETIYEMCK